PPQDHLSATPSRPALLNEEGKIERIPLLVEEGWREARGWWGFDRRKTTCPRHRRVLPSSTRRARSNAFPSSHQRTPAGVACRARTYFALMLRLRTTSAYFSLSAFMRAAKASGEVT